MKKLTIVIFFLINIFYLEILYGSSPDLSRSNLPSSPSRSSLDTEADWSLLSKHAKDNPLRLECASLEGFIGLFKRHFKHKPIQNPNEELRVFVKQVLDANSDSFLRLFQNRAQAKYKLKCLYAYLYNEINKQL